MDARVRRFSRFLSVLMVLLYVVSLGAFTYANWKAESDSSVWQAVINAPILSIPLVLLFGSVWVLGRAWYEHRVTGTVGPRLASVIHWAPRIAAIMIIFFVSLFSLDVFEMEATPLELLAGFLIHNVPSFALIVVLVFAWRRPIVGAVAFLLASLAFLRFVIPEGDPAHLLLFSGPLLLIAALFYTDWRRTRAHAPELLDTAV